jgi:hypothetical protein
VETKVATMQSKSLLCHFPSESAHPAIPLPEARLDPRALAAQERLEAETGALKQQEQRPHRPDRWKIRGAISGAD